MIVKLTTPLIRQLTTVTPPNRDERYFDAGLPRFYLRLRPPRTGQPGWASSYGVRYDHNGRERHLRIGSPATMSLEEAREAAKKVLRRVDDGSDPATERAAQRQAWTVDDAVEHYLASPEFARKSDKTRACDAGTLRNHIGYRLGQQKLSELDVPMVRRFVRSVEADTRKNARGRTMGGAGAARKCVRLLSSLLTWATNEGEVDRNVIVGNLRLDQGDGQRETVITELDQYIALVQAMNELVAVGQLRPLVRTFYTVMAYSGLRRGELQHLRWGQVDLTNCRIVLTRTKGGRLARRGPQTEVVSLPAPAAAALAELQPPDPDPQDLVFIPMRGKVVEVNRDWQRIRAAARLPDDLVPHGLRHSVGTIAAMNGMTGPEVQALLRHRSPGISARYIHLAGQLQLRLQDRAMAPVLVPPKDTPHAPLALVVKLRRR